MGELDLPIYAGVGAVAFCALCFGRSSVIALFGSRFVMFLMTLRYLLPRCLVCWLSYFALTSKQSEPEALDREAVMARSLSERERDLEAAPSLRQPGEIDNLTQPPQRYMPLLVLAKLISSRLVRERNVRRWYRKMRPNMVKRAYRPPAQVQRIPLTVSSASSSLTTSPTSRKPFSPTYFEYCVRRTMYYTL